MLVAEALTDPLESLDSLSVSALKLLAEASTSLSGACVASPVWSCGTTLDADEVEASVDESEVYTSPSDVSFHAELPRCDPRLMLPSGDSLPSAREMLQ